MKLQRTFIAAALAAFAAPLAAQQVTFMTGPQGGSWIPLGGALKGMWEKAVPGLSITSTPGAGIANVRGVDEGKAHIGLANSNTTVDGIEGRPPYPKKVTKVCQLANLYPQYFQVVALADAKKAMDMFERTNVPVLGVVENMAFLKTANGETVQLFPKGDLDAYLDVKKIEKLGQIPFYPEIGMSGEAGVPVLESHSGDELARAFETLAEKITARA